MNNNKKLLSENKLINEDQIEFNVKKIYNFMPYILKGFEHFYGKENIEHIKSKLNDALFLPYNSKSNDIEADIDLELNILYEKMEYLDSDIIEEQDKMSISECIKDAIINKRMQSGATTIATDNNKIIPLVMLEISEHHFYHKLIHECIHVIDTNDIDNKRLTGFVYPNEERTGCIFNEYFTDKIAVDIHNYLIENDCPILEGLEKIDPSKNGGYWLPDIFMNDFYQKYKKEICTCKLHNSLSIFNNVLGEESTKKIIDGCDFISKNIIFKTTNEQLEKCIAIRDECKKIVNDALKQKEHENDKINM